MSIDRKPLIDYHNKGVFSRGREVAMSKKRLWGKAMKHSLLISLFAILLAAATVSLASEPWWENRKPSPKDKTITNDCEKAKELCEFFGGTVMNGKYAQWCYNPGGPAGPGKYHKYFVCDLIPFAPIPIKPKLTKSPTKEEMRAEQKERIQRAAKRVSNYTNTIK